MSAMLLLLLANMSDVVITPKHPFLLTPGQYVGNVTVTQGKHVRCSHHT